MVFSDFLLLMLFLFSFYYLLFVARKPTLSYTENEFNNRIITMTPALRRRYFPTPWLFNTHLQLIVLGFIKGFAKPLEYD